MNKQGITLFPPPRCELNIFFYKDTIFPFSPYRGSPDPTDPGWPVSSPLRIPLYRMLVIPMQGKFPLCGKPAFTIGTFESPRGRGDMPPTFSMVNAGSMPSGKQGPGPVTPEPERGRGMGVLIMAYKIFSQGVPVAAKTALGDIPWDTNCLLYTSRCV